MTTITLSPRIKEIFRRFIDVEADDMIQHIKTLDDDSSGEEMNREVSIRAGNVVMKLCGGPGAHSDDCHESSGYLAYGETCSHCNHSNAYLHVSVGHSVSVLSYFVFLSHNNYDVKDITADTLYKWVETLREEWKLCQCNSIATIRDKCKICYIHRYERTEEQGGNCCVCHENDGRWIRYQCGHEIHLHCHRQIVEKKCPLCRAETLSSTSRIDPYDV